MNVGSKFPVEATQMGDCRRTASLMEAEIEKDVMNDHGIVGLGESSVSME